MEPAVYERDTDFILSLTTREDRIAAIDAIIDNLLVQQAAMATQTEPVTEYMLNDGQTIIKAVYRSPEQIVKAIAAMERLRNKYANMGRNVYRLVNVRNFIGNRSNE